MKQILIATASVFLLLGCKDHQTKTAENTPQAPAASAPAPAAAPAEPGVRQIDIKVSGGEYQPASVNVKKGEKVRLNFTRDEKPTCGDTLVFPALKIEKTIAVNQVTSVDITPEQTGDLEFTCGMNMLKGKVVVQ